jgi:hypothetical protein
MPKSSRSTTHLHDLAHNRWLFGIIAGLFVTLIEYIVLSVAAASDEKVDTNIINQSLLFWFTTSLIVVLSADSGFPDPFHGIIVTQLIMIPWWYPLVIIPKQYDHVIPLMVQNIIFGSFLGVMRKRAMGLSGH